MVEMAVDFNFLLISSGCLCALVFSAVFLFSRTNIVANRYLSFLILAFGLNLFLSLILNLGYYDLYPWLHLLPYGIGFGLGPLVYLYVEKLCTDRKPVLRHLLWLALDYPHSIYHLVFGRSADHELLHEILDKFGALSILVIGYYLWKSIRNIQVYQKRLLDRLSNIERQTLNWLKQLIVVFLVSIPLATALYALSITAGLDFNDRLAGHVYFVASIFWLGIGGIRQPQISYQRPKEPETSNVPKGIPLSHLRLLKESMERDKLYLLPDLSVRVLEDRLGLSAKQISEALNQGLNKNFYYFINEYRVEEFKIRAQQKPNLTLVGIAMECGFNSKTTFQRVFKEITGMKPSEFLSKSE